MTKRRMSIVLAGLVLCASASSGRAEDTAGAEGTAETETENAPARTGPAADPPWAVGVSEAARKQANALHARALRAAKDLFYADALRLYREALEHWDHPKIRYNTAFVLIKLDQPIEARTNLLRAIEYGDAPLGAETYQNALNYLELLSQQLTEVEVRSADAEVEVTLDGAPILRGAGSATKVVKPGEHQLVATVPGQPALVYRVPLWAERRHRIDVHPSRAMTRRWQPWKPWAAAGGGAALLAVGGLLHWRAQANFDAFDRRVLAECSTGCAEGEVPGAILDLERRAVLENRLAGVSFVLGGVSLAAGALLMYLNRPQREDGRAFDISVEPMAAPRTAGVSAHTRF